MDRPSIRRVAAVLVALTVGLTFAPVALACEVATTSVSFASAVGPARLVVVADVVSIPTGGRPGAFVLAVERTLRGASVSQLTIEAPYAGDLCAVSLAPGARVVLAMDDPSSLAVGTTTAWTVAPDGALTLDGLELLADGPSTSRR